MANLPYATELDGADADTAQDTDAKDLYARGSSAAVDRSLGDDGSRETHSHRQLSVLGQSLVFKGELTAEEDLLIQGRVEGSIKHNAQSLTVGAHGDVKADIKGRHIIIQGKVQGDVFATESVVVEASARMRGKIVAPRVGLKEGAKFKGSIDMDVDPEAPAKETKSKSGKAAGGTPELSESGVDEVLKK